MRCAVPCDSYSQPRAQRGCPTADHAELGEVLGRAVVSCLKPAFVPKWHMGGTGGRLSPDLQSAATIFDQFRSLQAPRRSSAFAKSRLRRIAERPVSSAPELGPRMLAKIPKTEIRSASCLGLTNDCLLQGSRHHISSSGAETSAFLLMAKWLNTGLPSRCWPREIERTGKAERSPGAAGVPGSWPCW